MGQFMTKHKYGNVIDFKITIDDKVSFEDASNETIKNGRILRDIIETKVLIFSVTKNKIEEFKSFVQNVEPFASYQIYSLDLEKEKEYFCFDYSLNKIPVIQNNGEILSCMSVISFKYDDDFFLILVKDKFKSFYSNIGGSSLLDEDSKSCIIREIKEEIGLVVGDDSFIINFGNLKKKTKIPVLGTTFKNNISLYNIFISERNVKNWLKNRRYNNYFNPNSQVNIIRTKNEEIEKIALLKINENIFSSDNYKIESRFISENNLDIISICYQFFYGIKNVKTCRSNFTNKIQYVIPKIKNF